MYYLIDKPNPSGPHYYTRRRPCQHGKTTPHLIVIHTAEVLPDWEEEDTAAEKVARYASTTTRQVSWHVTIDSDSTIPMLPDEYTAFHVRGFNSCSLGIEIGTQAHKWYGSPDEWRYSILHRIADQCAAWGKRWDIPATQLSLAQIGAGHAGLVGHFQLDPERRSDPGPAFPWNYLVKEMGARLQPTGPLTDDEIRVLRQMIAERR